MKAYQQQQHGSDPPDQCRCGEQPQAADLAIGHLPHELQSRILFGATPLLLQMGAFQFQAFMVSIESFL